MEFFSRSKYTIPERSFVEFICIIFMKINRPSFILYVYICVIAQMGYNFFRSLLVLRFALVLYCFETTDKTSKLASQQAGKQANKPKVWCICVRFLYEWIAIYCQHSLTHTPNVCGIRCKVCLYTWERIRLSLSSPLCQFLNDCLYCRLSRHVCVDLCVC